MIYRLRQMKTKFAWDNFMYLGQQNIFPATGSVHKIYFMLIHCTGRVVTRYAGSGIKGVGSGNRGGIRDQRGGIRDQKGGIRNQKGGIPDHSPGIRDHRPWDRDQQLFLGIRDQVVPYLWDQGIKLVMLLESRIRNLRAKMG